jgi:hypothetical protein
VPRACAVSKKLIHKKSRDLNVFLNSLESLLHLRCLKIACPYNFKGLEIFGTNPRNHHPSALSEERCHAVLTMGVFKNEHKRQGFLHFSLFPSKMAEQPSTLAAQMNENVRDFDDFSDFPRKPRSRPPPQPLR